MAGETNASTDAPHVRFIGVQKTYDGASLRVRDLNPDIRRGEFLTLLGPSGSGKTTTLMMLAGFETPTSGEILLEGKVINRVPPHKRNIGMVFQNYALFPHMTVADNLRFPLRVRKLSTDEIEARVRRALAMIRLEEYAERYPQQLSGGQQQRVALARALVFDPQLVLMDEPLGALDKNLREQMQLEIKHLQRTLGVTVVFVTHDQGEALTMSDRIAVFHQGAIQQIDTPERIYEHPVNSFVANFIGENNVLPGIVRRMDGGTCEVELDCGPCVIACRGPVGLGERTLVCIRPERVVLAPPENHPNRLGATVRETIYLGDQVRICLVLGPQQEFVIKVPISRFDPSWSVGTTLHIGLDPHHLHALDAPAS